MNKMLTLVENGDPEENGSKGEAVAELVKQFYKEYESLHSPYDHHHHHLTEEISGKDHGKQENESSSSSSSSSDSEPDCSPWKTKHKRNERVQNDLEAETDILTQEFAMANLEIADLKRKLTLAMEEKKDLNAEHQAALGKLKESDEVVGNLKVETRRLDAEKARLSRENRKLRGKLEDASKIDADINQKLEDVTKERNELSKEKEKEADIRRFQVTEKVAKGIKTTNDRLKDENAILEQEVGALRKEAYNLRQQLEASERRVSEMGHGLKTAYEENKSLSLKVSELSDENRLAQNTIQGLMAELRALKEKLKGSELELKSLNRQRNKLEEEMRIKTEENGQVEEENAGMRDKIHVLGKSLEEKVAELSDLRDKHIEGDNKASVKTTALKEQISNLQQESASLKTLKNEIELQLEREKQEKFDLLNQNNDHRRISLEQEAAYSKMNEDYKPVDSLFKEQVGTISKLSEQYKQAREMLEEYKARVEVSEQVISEKEDAFRKAEAKYLEEQGLLEERINTMSGTITATHKSYQGMIREISEKTNITLDGLQSIVERLMEQCRDYEKSINEASREFRTATNWIIKAKQEKDELNKQVYGLSKQLHDTQEQESILREKVQKLEVKAITEKENERLTETLRQLQTTPKQKDEGTLCLEGGKRETIWQLCLWIDYHRSRCEHFKDVLSNTVTNIGQRP